MRKTAIALVIVFATGMSLTSCKKDYTCSCQAHIPSDTVNGFIIDAVDSSYTVEYNDIKKKDAEANCDQAEADNNDAVKGFNGTVTCDLDKK
jgi:hypothetical protein